VVRRGAVWARAQLLEHHRPAAVAALPEAAVSAPQRVRRRWKREMATGMVILCSLCGEKIPRHARGAQRLGNGGKGGLTADHIIPSSRGGRDVVANLAPAHVRCNQEKGDRLWEEMSVVVP